MGPIETIYNGYIEEREGIDTVETNEAADSLMWMIGSKGAGGIRIGNRDKGTGKQETGRRRHYGYLGPDAQMGRD